MKLEDMTDSEKQALGTLIRVMVKVDGSYSPEESALLQQTAEELGEEEFWQLISASGRKDLTEAAVKAQALEVEREVVREKIYSLLFAIATAGSIVDQEGWLLDWLAGTWNLETANPTSGKD